MVRLFAPGTADSYDLFAVEGELLLEALPTVPTLAILASPVDPVVSYEGWLTDILEPDSRKDGLQRKLIFSSCPMQGVCTTILQAAHFLLGADFGSILATQYCSPT